MQKLNLINSLFWFCNRTKIQGIIPNYIIHKKRFHHIRTKATLQLKTKNTFHKSQFTNATRQTSITNTFAKKSTHYYTNNMHQSFHVPSWYILLIQPIKVINGNSLIFLLIEISRNPRTLPSLMTVFELLVEFFRYIILIFDASMFVQKAWF